MKPFVNQSRIAFLLLKTDFCAAGFMQAAFRSSYVLVSVKLIGEAPEIVFQDLFDDLSFFGLKAEGVSVNIP